MRTFGYIPEFSRYVRGLFSLTASSLSLEEIRGPCLDWGWRLVEYFPGDGVARFELAEGVQAVADSAKLGGLRGRPILHLPLYYWPDDNNGHSRDAQEGRDHFDQAFATARQAIVSCLGKPDAFGVYEYRHRPGWPYSYAAWRGARAFFILLQDEIDIQFGMDVSIWLIGRKEDEQLPAFPLG